MEKSLVMIKPNGLELSLIGEIIGRYEKSKLKLGQLKMLQLDKDTAGKFYEEHKDKPFFGELVDFMTSGPIIVMVILGDKAVEKVRVIHGATKPENADAGTIRHDYAPNGFKNIVHASDSPESADREYKIHFGESAILNY